MRETYDRRSIELSLQRLNRRLRELFVTDTCNVLTHVDGRPVIHTQMQLFFNLKHEEPVDRCVYELIIAHAVAAEKLGPGAFRLFLEGLFDFSRANMNVTAICPTTRHVDMLVDRYARNQRVAAIVRAALDLAGCSGKIVVEKTQSTTASVELVRGYTFDLHAVFPIDVNFLNPRVAVIDGYIESVAEANHMFQAASEAKEPMVLFARGFHDDVKSTLRVNYDRGSLRIVPIEVRFDLEGMNTLVDISVVSGSDLVSSLKGDLITSMKYQDLSYVDQVTVFRGKTMIVNRASRQRVAAHVSQLRARRSDERVDDVARLLDARVRSLSPNHVVVRLPSDRDFVVNSQSIDYVLRSIKSAIAHGVNNEGMPAATAMAVAYHLEQCRKTLDELGAVVTP